MSESQSVHYVMSDGMTGDMVFFGSDRAAIIAAFDWEMTDLGESDYRILSID